MNLISLLDQFGSVLLGHLSRADTFESGNFLSKLITYPFLSPVLLAVIVNNRNLGFKYLGSFGLGLYLISLIAMGHKFTAIGGCSIFMWFIFSPEKATSSIQEGLFLIFNWNTNLGFRAFILSYTS